jgi:hypothetical protein
MGHEEDVKGNMKVRDNAKRNRRGKGTGGEREWEGKGNGKGMWNRKGTEKRQRK